MTRRPGQPSRAASLAMAVLTLVLAVQATTRLSPDDPAVWDQPTAPHAEALARATPGPDCATALTALGQANPAQVGCHLPGSPEETLARLDAIALSHPRVTRLAGDPQSHRITWISRSLLWGFPDYITAEADAEGGETRLDVLSRQRYGASDLGVNAARLKDWLSQL